MRGKFNLDRNADSGTVIVWLGGVFVIVFILFVYFVFVYSMGGLKETMRKERTELDHESTSYPAVLNNFYYFIESNSGNDHEDLLVKDLVKYEPENDSDKYSRFQKVSQEFLRQKIVKQDSKRISIRGMPERAWIRIYSFEENITRFSERRGQSDRYSYYSSYIDRKVRCINMNNALCNVVEERQKSPCDPYSKRSELFYYIIPNKKRIVLCVEYG